MLGTGLGTELGLAAVLGTELGIELGDAGSLGTELGKIPGLGTEHCTKLADRDTCMNKKNQTEDTRHTVVSSDDDCIFILIRLASL